MMFASNISTFSDARKLIKYNKENWMFRFNHFKRVTASTILIIAALPTISACTSSTGKNQTKVANTIKLQAPTSITQVEGISEYRLENGLKVLLFPDQTKETVTVNVTYHVGSKHENYGETGMAHLLEHLVFKGTPNHKDIPKELSSHGARPNGTTWTDRTNYFETFSATEKNINWALDMEADRMVNSFIAKKDLDSEMTVVRNEFESGENRPFGVTLKRMMAAAFSWHNYGKSTIGAKADLENVPIERLKAFYKKYYQPDNATLIVAGKFTNEEMLARVNKYFGVIPKPNRVIPPLYTREPAQDGEKSVTVRRVGDVQLYSTMYHIPAGSHPDYAAIDVLSKILGDTPTGRLHKNVVEEKLASRTFGFNFQWQEPGLMIFAAQVDKSFDLDTTRNKMLATIENIAEHKITQKEVDRAKRLILKNIELSFNSSEDIALNLSEWLGMGDWRLYFLHRDRIESVTTEDVQRVAQAYLTQNNRTAGRFIPTSKPERVEIPQVGSVAAMLDGYQGKAQIAQGEDFEPSFDNIDQRTKRITLSNGAKVALLSKKTRGESVSISINMRFGDKNSLNGLTTTSDAVGAMLMRGTTQYSREELNDEFDKLKAQVSFGTWSTATYARITTTKENISEVLALATSVFKSPRFDDKEFEQYKATRKVDIEQNQQDPQRLAFNEYARKQNQVAKGHPLYIASFDEMLTDLAALQVNELKTFHENFFGASAAKIAIIGDFDEQEVSTQLEELYGNWVANKPFKRVSNSFKKMPVKDVNFNTPDKENAVFVAAITLQLSENDEDAAALELGNYMLGGGFLNSRLAIRLRQKDGLSYGAGSFISPSSFDDKTKMGAYAISAPQNLNKVENAFKEEISRLLKEGFTDEEVAGAKSGLLQEKRVSRAQDNELSREFLGHLYVGRDMQWNKAYEARLAQSDAKEVNRVMNKYIKLEDFSIIKAGDMSKVEKK
jgi:zinc protease